MVFNATFNNISVISGRSVLFVEETRDIFFSENHGKLETKKNSVIDGQIVIIQAFMGESI
jgi:large exoprotein involved in heme utilization and adhesion